MNFASHAEVRCGQDSIAARTNALLREHQASIWKRTDRLFAGLLLFEWVAGIALAFWRTPRTWIGATSGPHPHIWAATILAAVVIALPLYLAMTRPGQGLTRHAIAIGQMLMSGLLIHLGDGRIEMHFHVFGSLAFLAFYRDWRVLITASTVVAVDHLIRGILLPQSVYGVLSASVLRTLEHAGWVVFEDIFLVASCIQSVCEMRGIAEQRALLEHSHSDVEQKVIDRTRQLEAAQDDLLLAARSAGMAEIATSVLHNVGNVLNSVNVSASVMADQVRQSEVQSLGRVSEMIKVNGSDLGYYLVSDAQGKLIPGFIVELADCLAREQQQLLAEMTNLSHGVDHIRSIVAAQQSMAKPTMVKTAVEPTSLMETALLMQSGSLGNRLKVVRAYSDCPTVELDKHAVLQILINLICNAAQAMQPADAAGVDSPQIELQVGMTGSLVRFVVKDNGVGIPTGNLQRIFSHGFTTKCTGHGFGLHGAANSARAMGGTLSAQSDGPDRGAQFTLELPATVVEKLESHAKQMRHQSDVGSWS